MNSKSLSDYYYNHSFMDGLRKKLPKLLPNTYCIAAIDIEHFRLFNKLYGRSSGDEVIRYICACLKQSTMENDGIDAYLGEIILLLFCQTVMNYFVAYGKKL